MSIGEDDRGEEDESVAGLMGDRSWAGLILEGRGEEDI
jgi:hypothetical protein